MPNFFIVGAPKSGTTSLYLYLDKIDSVFMSPVKEPGYFSPSFHKYKSVRAITDKDEYLDLFKNVKNEIAIGEATPTYLFDPQTPNLIKKIIPKAKIIMILRNPIERAFSHYLHITQHRNETLSFHDIIRGNYEKSNNNDELSFIRQTCVEHSFYSEPVNRYFKIFGNDKVKILIFEEFVKNIKRSLEEVLEFFKVHYGFNEFKFEQYNPYFEPKGKIGRFIITNKTTRAIGKKFFSQSMQTKIIENYLTKKAEKPIPKEEDKEFLSFPMFIKQIIGNIRNIDPDEWRIINISWISAVILTIIGLLLYSTR